MQKPDKPQIPCCPLFAASLLLVLLIPAACSLVSLRSIGYTTYPAYRNQVVQAGEALYIEFSMPVREESAENYLKVSLGAETPVCDLYWEGTRLLWIPAAPLLPGRRYLFSFQGQVESACGELFPVRTEIPFFAVTDSAPPVISACTLQDGSDMAVTGSLVITFSSAVDQDSFKEGFVLAPKTAHTLLWNVDSTAVTVSPVLQWTPVTFYRWQVKDTVKDTAGVSIAYDVSGGFITQADCTAPLVTTVSPAARAPAGFNLLPGTLDDLTKYDSILITFSEAVDFTLLQSAFSLTPAVSGHMELIDTSTFAYVPDTGFVMNTVYLLKITTACKDLAGIPLKQNYQLRFTPAIPLLQVTEIRNLPELAAFIPAQFNQPQAYPVALQPPGRTHTFIIVFSQVIDAAHRETVSGSISCSAWFPPGIPTLNFSLESTGWNPSGTELSLGWTGFANSPSSSEPYYYKLTIPGTESGVCNSAGSFLVDDIFLYLKAPQ